MFTLTLDPPEVSPRLAVITIDRPGEKVNTISPEALAEVEQQFAAIEATPGLAGIILISGKRDGFIAGADVEVFAHAKERREIEGFGRRGHEVLLPKGAAYQLKAAKPSVTLIQTSAGPESVEKWSEICVQK